ncbi:N(G),N(G)-dimethylarginine dimethylaminohydrolase 1-like [Branchiostoma floridae]|uniref:N(G),N(G)-dimethylarginine dimethylaminohydrolase 1-like n=1 Tax=Branchiostoma floridae TaxID=7739 RepID=A0A9J7KFX7_BRAFL|nr:N(G),N(G)-dimethylarginine dimethylaminohydrolase 1-like [Branchiostoma floridae]
MADIWNFPEFTRAVVREVSDNVNNATRSPISTEDIDLDKCRAEWELYVQTLRDLGLDVTVIPQDPSLPDCMFVEDSCIVVGDTALITRPACGPRQGETAIMEEIMANLGLKVKVVESDTATLEGGDVIFTGKEIFCGDSVLSNEEGFAILQETFPDYPCHSIFVEYPEFHLKGYMALAAPGVIATCDNEWGHPGWKDICDTSNYTYKPLWIPDDFGNNCMFINGNIIHTTDDQKPDTYAVFKKQMADYNLIAMPTEEVSKVDAALTCQSILF